MIQVPQEMANEDRHKEYRRYRRRIQFRFKSNL